MKNTHFHINHALINYSKAIVFNNVAYVTIKTVEKENMSVKFNLN
jgi:hypothetical protein